MNKCSILGHDWFRRHSQGTRQCLRDGCTAYEEYSVSETHEDDDAEKGESRLVVEEDNGTHLVREKYQCTGWSDDSEYWQWYPVERIYLTEEYADTLREAADKLEP